SLASVGRAGRITAAATRLTPPKATIITKNTRTGRYSDTALGIIPRRQPREAAAREPCRMSHRSPGEVVAPSTLTLMRRETMRIGITLSLAVVVGLVAVGSVLAFSCPTL